MCGARKYGCVCVVYRCSPGKFGFISTGSVQVTKSLLMLRLTERRRSGSVHVRKWQTYCPSASDQSPTFCESIACRQGLRYGMISLVLLQWIPSGETKPYNPFPGAPVSDLLPGPG